MFGSKRYFSHVRAQTILPMYFRNKEKERGREKAGVGGGTEEKKKKSYFSKKRN